MRKARFLPIWLVLVVLLGCQVHHDAGTAEEAAQIHPSKERQQGASAEITWGAPLDVTDLCQIIPRELAELGLTVEDHSETATRCQYNCKSLSGENVIVVATATVKAQSMVQVKAPVNIIANTVRREVSEAIRKAVMNRRDDP